jgi:SAM-dependent methyltransferase
MDWTAGYASDIEYTAGFYGEQSPSHLNFVCSLNGYESIALDRPYTYCELGCGRALTSIILAATNPMGTFYAADFNPAHIVGARDIASTSQIPNLHLIENSFEEMAAGLVPDLPQFDFITLHGIYSWVTAENRQFIVQFMARYLKPGGVVYVSYNAMPGWSTALPLQRLLLEHAGRSHGRSDALMKSAAVFLQQLEGAKAGYFKANPGLKPRMQKLANGNVNYLVHEYLNQAWQPLYFADVAKDFAQAKLDFVGSAELALAYPSIFFTPDKLDLINGGGDPVYRETIKDYFLNTSFRKDVFVRGARSMPALRQKETLQELQLVTVVPRHAFNLKLKFGHAEIDARAEVYVPFLDALSLGPKSILELSRLPALQALSPHTIWQVAALLVASGQVAISIAPQLGTLGVTAQRLNRVIANEARYSDDYQVLAAPLCGGGVGAHHTERLMLSALMDHGEHLGAQQLAQHVWDSIQKSGRRMANSAQPMQDNAENLTALRAMVESTITHKLPLWKTLGIL